MVNRGDDDVEHYDKDRNFINTQIPLTWLISAFVAVILFMFGVAMKITSDSHDITVKMDTMIVTMSDFKKRADDRDAAFALSRENVYSMQRTLDAHDLRIQAMERAKR